MQLILGPVLLINNDSHHLKFQQDVDVYLYACNLLLLISTMLLIHDYANGYGDVPCAHSGRDYNNDRVNAYYFPLSSFNNSSIHCESNFPERIISISFLYGAI